MDKRAASPEQGSGRTRCGDAHDIVTRRCIEHPKGEPPVKTFTKVIAATAFCIPILASAQTVTPPDQPRTNLEKQQTTQSGQATRPQEGDPPRLEP
jgi:hypothetical protein